MVALANVASGIFISFSNWQHLNGSSVLECFECGNAIEIRNRIMFNFYLGLSHNYAKVFSGENISGIKGIAI